MSDVECQHRGVPSGSFSLMMSKHEIDGAAKDIKNILFPTKFKLEILFGTLNLKGTGPSLQAAVNGGERQTVSYLYTYISLEFWNSD